MHTEIAESVIKRFSRSNSRTVSANPGDVILRCNELTFYSNFCCNQKFISGVGVISLLAARFIPFPPFLLLSFLFPLFFPEKRPRQIQLGCQQS